MVFIGLTIANQWELETVLKCATQSSAEDFWWSWKHYQADGWGSSSLLSASQSIICPRAKHFLVWNWLVFNNSARGHVEELPVQDHKLIPSCSKTLQASYCLQCGPVQILVLQHLHTAKLWFSGTLEPEWGTSGAPRARITYTSCNCSATASLLLEERY